MDSCISVDLIIEPGDLVHCRNRRGCYRVLALHSDGTATIAPVDESWIKGVFPPLRDLTPAHLD